MTTSDRAGTWRPADRATRAVRSVAAALVCVTAAAVGHHSAGGALPVAAIGVVFTCSFIVTWSLSRRRVTVSQLSGLLLLCQVGVHLATMSGGGMSGGAMSGAGMSGAGMSGGGMPDGPMTMGMVAAHVVASVVSVVVLARGEHLVWQLARRLALRALPLLRAVTPTPTTRRPARITRSAPAPRDVLLAHSLWLRGPPVGTA